MAGVKIWENGRGASKVVGGQNMGKMVGGQNESGRGSEKMVGV